MEPRVLAILDNLGPAPPAGQGFALLPLHLFVLYRLRMLCGLPLPWFSKKTKRVRPVISAPLPQGSPAATNVDVMNSNGWNHLNDDARTESGVYYLVKNSATGVKEVVKRPRPPPTSTELDDDFDAYTQTGIGTTSRFPEEYSHSRSHGVSSPYEGLKSLRRVAWVEQAVPRCLVFRDSSAVPEPSYRSPRSPAAAAGTRRNTGQ
ncbi:hypothetical protein H1R20_g1222, partial [Candolleomyces eurysporus]